MAAIHEYGTIWKDTEPGIWTGFVEVVGLKVLAHAVEVKGKGRDQSARTVEGAELLAMLPPGVHCQPMQTFRLADMDCTLVIAS
jgi:hypothetical protein